MTQPVKVAGQDVATPFCCRGGLGDGEGHVAKRIRDPVSCFAVSVASVSAQEGDRLLPIEGANRQPQPPRVVPVEAARGGDDGPNSGALGDEVSQVVGILHVVEDEETVAPIR